MLFKKRGSAKEVILMDNLLIIGAGYVGMALLSSLKGMPCTTSLTTTRRERVEELQKFGKSVLLLQPGTQDGLEECIETCDALFVFIAPKNSNNYEATYLNTAKRISAALKNRKKPPYLLYTSSTSVYEGAESNSAAETTPLNPRSENAKILRETENVYLQSNADTCILRLGGIYGPGRQLIDRARRFSGSEMSGSGDSPTNSIHLDDIVSAILFCFENSLTGIYNLVNDDHPSRKELYNNLCISNGFPLPIWNAAHSIEKSYKVSNQKIKEAGFALKHPFILNMVRDGS